MSEDFISILKDLVRKIELQSILVLLITLLFGCILLYIDNSLSSPAGILGSISIFFGILYTFGSFFSNQIKESYKDVIVEYKSTISTLKSSHREIQKYYKETLSDQQINKKVGDYELLEEVDNVTQK